MKTLRDVVTRSVEPGAIVSTGLGRAAYNLLLGLKGSGTDRNRAAHEQASYDAELDVIAPHEFRRGISGGCSRIPCGSTHIHVNRRNT